MENLEADIPSASKVVFVGNVPYNMGEEQLINVFKTVGQVVGFRLVFDRETGKPRGYGFCEFADNETAESAVRNLNGVDVGGRPLRVDLADSDPFLEGKTTQHGELVDSGETRAQWREREKRERMEGDGRNPSNLQRNETNSFLRSLPPGVPLVPGTTSLDAISHTLATMNPAQLTEVLAQMKAFVINHPDQARVLLISHPQLAYALFQALLLNKIVDPAILQRMLAATHASSNGGPGTGTPVQAAPQRVLPQASSLNPQPPGMISQFPPYPPPPMQHVPPIQQAPPLQQTPPIADSSAFYRPPQPGVPSHVQAKPPLPPNIDAGQREMLMQVLALSQEQIDNLPPNEREAIKQLKSQFMGILNPAG